MSTAQAAQIGAVVIVCLTTLLVGAVGMRFSRTTSDFYVASRGVSPAWNASAIGGEYLSAASFLGVAGLILVGGADMLWFPIGYTAGYVVLLVLVAAPLRRSGAYTLPDFAEIRMQSLAVRRTCALLVVGIGWLYLLPQFQAAGVALSAVAGTPRWAGSLVVAAVVLVNVVSGGMRSITFVQAFQYWLKLTAISLPAVVLLLAWHNDGQPGPAGISGDWLSPAGFGQGDHELYRIYSLLLALLFGTMGLPHVLVRFYTNPDGRAARRTTVAVLGLIGLFYLFPPVYGVLGRIYASDLALAHSDTIVLELPGRIVGGGVGLALSALVTAGAFAAFLSTSSGLTVSVAGVLSQDLLRDRLRGSVAGFRVGALLAICVPLALSLTPSKQSLAVTVGLAFAVSASTFCPLLVLGIWWRGLTVPGALAGLCVGGLLALVSVSATLSDHAGTGWGEVLLAQPAAWTVPVTFAVMVVTSLLTRSQTPPAATRVMVRLHTPEALAVDRALPY